MKTKNSILLNPNNVQIIDSQFRCVACNQFIFNDGNLLLFWWCCWLSSTHIVYIKFIRYKMVRWARRYLGGVLMNHLFSRASNFYWSNNTWCVKFKKWNGWRKAYSNSFKLKIRLESKTIPTISGPGSHPCAL